MNLNVTLFCKLGALVWMVCAAPAAFAFEIKPGQWQMKSQGKPNVQMQAEMEQAMAEMKNMPPQQRQQMEQMLAQMGMVPGAGFGAITYCITPEEAKASNVPVSDEDGCNNKLVSKTKNAMKIEFSCPDTKGTAQVQFVSGTEYVSTVNGSAKHEGKWVPFNQTMRSTWVKTSCK